MVLDRGNGRNLFVQVLSFVAVAGSLTWTSVSFAASSSCEHDENSFRCVQYVHNYDGDTFTVNIPQIHPLLGDQITVRVRGIDSPEMTASRRCEREKAEKAQKLVQSLLSHARVIEINNLGRDKYFRILADAYVDGKSVGETLLRKGLAVPYDGGTRPDVNWCR